MKIKTLVCVLLLAATVPAHAMERFEIITTQQLRQMLSERDAGKIDFLLVNTLDQLIFEHHAIPGSINIPWTDVIDSAQKLGADKDRLIVTY